MIWIPRNSEQNQRDALVSHIAETISDYSLTGALGDANQAGELAAAVAAFLESQPVDEGAVDAGYLVLLASQALNSVGEDRDAQRLLMFGSGLVEPAEWDVTGGEEVWTVDLRRMSVTREAPLELLFFNALGMIVESIADVWDPTEGVGVLGLRHVHDSARALLGGDSRKGDVIALSDEITSTCRSRLERVALARGWGAVPALMNLDI